jgi:hypothetical protein
MLLLESAAELQGAQCFQRNMDMKYRTIIAMPVAVGLLFIT